jgi:hypothetical protein
MFAVSYLYSLIVVAVERIRPAGPGSEFLGLDALLATANTAKALLQGSAHTLSSSVAASNTRGFGFECLGWDWRFLVITKALAMAMARSHLNAAVPILVILQGFLDGIGGLALAFEVIWVVNLRAVSDKSEHGFQSGTYLSRPTPIIATWFPLKIGSLLIVENPTKAVWHTRWDVGNSFQRAVLRYGIYDVFTGSRPQCFLVRLADCFDGWILHMPVPRDAGGVIRALVMVSSGARCIEPINDISALEVLLSKMRGTVSNLFIFADRIEWSVGHVSRVSLLKRAAACQALALRLDWSWVT